MKWIKSIWQKIVNAFKPSKPISSKDAQKVTQSVIYTETFLNL